MIAYSISIITLVNKLKHEIHDVTEPWYAEDDGALGTFMRLETYFYLLTRKCLGRGYHPEPSKSTLIVCPDNIEAGKVFVARHGFKVCTGARYLGGYILDDESKHDWLKQRTLTRRRTSE